MNSLTLIIPICENFDKRYLQATLESVRHQKKIPQVIVSECSNVPSLQYLEKEEGVSYVFTQGNIPYRMGDVRNAALSQVESDLVFFSDPDIFFIDPNFFGKILDAFDGSIWAHPRMRRIQLNEILEFFIILKTRGYVELIGDLILPDNHLASLNKEYASDLWIEKSNRSVHDFHKDRPLTISPRELKAFNRMSRGWKYHFWHDTVHRGGMLTFTQYAREVGGFCRDYIGYGYEDIDLLKKLSVLADVMPLFELDTEVLHLDHDKSYFDVAQVKENLQKYKARSRHSWNVLCRNDQDASGIHPALPTE